MKIYDDTGKVLLDVEVDDRSYRYRSIRQGDKVYLYYSLSEHMEIPVGSYIHFNGGRYTLWRPEDLTKHGTRNLEYALTLGGDWERMNRIKYKHLSAMPLRLEFQLTGKPLFFLQLLVDNLNETDSGWNVGRWIDAPEKTLAFSHEYCLEVLNRLADEWDTEFEIDGKTINFGRVEYNKEEPLPLSYGKGNGFKTGVSRQNQGDKAPASILYVQGGERNIDPTTYGSRYLLLPKEQELTYEGRRYKTDPDGILITRADRELAHRNEDSYDASDIYPSRVGTVSQVVTVDAEANLYDIIDTTIPEDLDYAQCRIPGEKATIIFQSGVMTGEELEIEQTEEAITGYVHAERRFKLVPQEKDGGMIPNENRKPSPGDTYAVFNISLPDAYVCDNETQTGASWDMFREAVRYLFTHEEETFTFNGELDGIWSRQRWLEIGAKLRPGGYIFFSDTQFQPDGVAIRITGIKDYVNRPYSPEIELSNTPVAGFLSSELGKIESNEVVMEAYKRDAMSYTRRRFRDAQETGKMLEQAVEGFSAAINPVTVSTMQLLVGAEQYQFRYVNSKSNPVEVTPVFTMNDDTGVFTAPAGIIQHLTLGIDTLSSGHAASEYKFWDITAYTSPSLDEDQEAFYLYARCDKDGTTATYVLDHAAHRSIDPGDGYYWLLVGTLGSLWEGARSFETVYGFTEILPGRITTNIIKDPGANLVIDLVEGTISARKATLEGYTTSAELKVQADRITATVERVEGLEKSAAGWITTADGNKLWASKTLEDGNQIISYINQTATTLTISGSRINLNGVVTFNSFSSSLQGLINGKADESDLGDLAFQDYIYSADLSTSLQNIINGKADENDLGALAYLASVDYANLTTNLKNILNGKEDSDNLGSVAYLSDIANAMCNGKTFIIGGYINTQLLQADEILANAAKIGGFKISNLWLNGNSGAGITTTGSNGLAYMGDITQYAHNVSLAATKASFGTVYVGETGVTLESGGSITCKGVSCTSISASSNISASSISSSTDISASGTISATGGLKAKGYTGIDINYSAYDLDDIRFVVRGGLIIGVTSDSGTLKQGVKL